MSGVPEHDDAHLTRADVDLIWWMRASRVVPALRNFAALRFIRLPLNRGVGRVIEEPLRGVVNAVGRKEGLTRTQRRQVYDATLIAVVGLPLGMALPSPFGILHELDHIVDSAPEIRPAVLEVWNLIDDRDFWSVVGESIRRSGAVS
jgi:hypothetical protein